jgi:rare lipoprotein A (peptidoglycan hydrolase)
MTVALFFVASMMYQVNGIETIDVVASWYYKPGREMAWDGKKFDPDDGTIIASNTFPKGTRLKLTYAKTGVSAIGQVVDRMPHHKKRQLDVCMKMAERLGAKDDGVVHLKAERLPDQ